jgi:hypothetical protein
MKLRNHTRVLDPLERFSEIVFGLIMVLTFTSAIGATDAGRNDVRAVLVGALGCNLAWGIIDAAMYLMAVWGERGLGASAVRTVQQAVSPDVGRAKASSSPLR